ncbi:MAG: hypothetical protein ACKO37_05610 [Vampirovibrionales bacterium]
MMNTIVSNFRPLPPGVRPPMGPEVGSAFATADARAASRAGRVYRETFAPACPPQGGCDDLQALLPHLGRKKHHQAENPMKTMLPMMMMMMFAMTSMQGGASAQGGFNPMMMMFPMMMMGMNDGDCSGKCDAQKLDGNATQAMLLAQASAGASAGARRGSILGGGQPFLPPRGGMTPPFPGLKLA